MKISELVEREGLTEMSASGKKAARDDHRLGKTQKNPWHPKYHKDSKTQWDSDYAKEMDRLEKKDVEESMGYIGDRRRFFALRKQSVDELKAFIANPRTSDNDRELAKRAIEEKLRKGMG